MFLVDTGTSASCISINMLDDKEQRSIDSPSDMPHQVLTVNRDDIQIFGKIAQTVQFDNQLHFHQFLVTALPRPLFGWDFLKDHLVRLKAAPETIHLNLHRNQSARFPTGYPVIDQ